MLEGKGVPGSGGPPRELGMLIAMALALVVIAAAIPAFHYTAGRGAGERRTETDGDGFGPLADFRPLERLDRDFLVDNTWDFTQIMGPGKPAWKFRQEAFDTLLDDYKAYLYAIRYLRTLSREGKEPEGGFRLVSQEQYHSMARSPEELRGAAVRLRGRFIRHNTDFTVPDEAEAAKAGVKQLCFIYFEDMERQTYPFLQGSGNASTAGRPEPRWYLVVSPFDLRPLIKRPGALYEVRGVFVRRWPPNPKSDRWLPVIAALEPVRLTIPSDAGGSLWLKVVLAVIVLFIGVLVLGYRDRPVHPRRRRASGSYGGKKREGKDASPPDSGPSSRNDSTERADDDVEDES